MLFNSLEFAIFLPIVFLLYWFATKRKVKNQNILLILAGFVFYGWWDWRFLLLLVGSTIVDFVAGLQIDKTEDKAKRKLFLGLSIATNLGILFFFKYFNFFTENFITAFRLFGQPLSPVTLKIILPVGVSFYTFQALSYTIDVYRRALKPTRSLVNYFAFISFFPQLLAGPIERATHMLPQFYNQRTFDYTKAVDGMKQILWGLFKKIVIADNCARFANLIFNNSADYSGSTHVLGALFFTFQIYCDFSGYSDIAIGVARLFGFELMRNFAFPYFSRDIAEFWRRWHISLSSWFRDYIYIPLGGSKGGTWMKVRNTFIIFLVSGFWHGANWTFIAWGALNAIYFLPLLLMKRNRENLLIVAHDRHLPTAREFLNILLTFSLTVFAWIFFRAENMSHAIAYISKIFSASLFEVPALLPKKVILLIIIFMLIEWQGRAYQYAIANVGFRWPRIARWSFYYALILIIFLFVGKPQQFIYFQF